MIRALFYFLMKAIEHWILRFLFHWISNLSMNTTPWWWFVKMKCPYPHQLQKSQGWIHFFPPKLLIQNRHFGIIISNFLHIWIISMASYIYYLLPTTYIIAIIITYIIHAEILGKQHEHLNSPKHRFIPVSSDFSSSSSVWTCKSDQDVVSVLLCLLLFVFLYCYSN